MKIFFTGFIAFNLLIMGVLVLPHYWNDKEHRVIALVSALALIIGLVGVGYATMSFVNYLVEVLK